MLTNAGSRSAMARINGHMYFRNVLGSIAPVDPPTVEQTVACLGYAFKKWRVHRRCLIFPSGGMMSWFAIKIHNFATTNGPAPKNSRKWRSSVPADPIGRPALFWMSFPPRRKSPTVGSDILFRFVSLSSMSRVGAWKSKSELREEGVGDQPRCLLLSTKREELRACARGWWPRGFSVFVFFFRGSLFRSCVMYSKDSFIASSRYVHCGHTSFPPL